MKRKFMAMSFTLLLIMQLFVFIGAKIINAQNDIYDNIIKIDINENEDFSKETINELAGLIEYVFEKAAVLDSKGNIVDVVIEKTKEICDDSQD